MAGIVNWLRTGTQGQPLSLPFFFFSFHLFFWFFAISSFCSRIPCHISIRYTCIKEPVDFRNKNTETPHSAWLKSRVEIFAEATLHASQKIVWLFAARFSNSSLLLLPLLTNRLRSTFLSETENMKPASKRDESKPSFDYTVDSFVTSLTIVFNISLLLSIL